MSNRFFRLDNQGSVPVHAVETGPDVDLHVRNAIASGMPLAAQGFALVAAMFTLSQSKLLADLEADGQLQAKDAAARNDYDYRQTLGLLRFLTTQGIFNEEPNETFRLTPRGTAAVSPTGLSLVVFYVGGYGHLMMRSGQMLEKKISYGRDIRREPYYVAAGSKLNTATIMDPVSHAVLAHKGVRTVCDLGCGTGQFLINWCKGGPDRRGVGVDLAPEAIEAARVAAKAEGVGDRIEFVVADAFDNDAFAKAGQDVDAFHSFAMEHEGLRDGEGFVLSHIDTMAEKFPGKRYLLGEPMLHMNQNDGIFYWIHMLSMQGIPRNVPGWCELLTKLKRAKLADVYVPDHRQWCGYFDIEFPK